MYSVFDYGQMIGDKIRVNAYMEALHRTVKPGDIVMDIGTGTGIFAVVACRLGAKRVYAVECGDVIQIAQEIARANGVAERIEFIQGLSTNIEISEPASLIISDLRGILPLFQNHLSGIIDARTRFLAPDGTMIPERDTLWTALVEAPDLYDTFVAPWENQLQGIQMLPARQLAINQIRKVRVTPDQLLTRPLSWANLDYAALETTDVTGKAKWVIKRPGTAHGLIVWFDSELVKEVSFSNSPLVTKLIYGSAFFPLLEPVRLSVNDSVSVNFQAKFLSGDYVWSWKTTVLSAQKKLKAEFNQSTFFAVPLSRETLQKKAHRFVPFLNEDGRIDETILNLFDSQMSLADIAREIAERFPERFPGWHAAMERVGKLSQAYSL